LRIGRAVKWFSLAKRARRLVDVVTLVARGVLEGSCEERHLNEPIRLNSKWTTADVVRALREQKPTGRVYLDRRGDFSTRPPFANFKELVIHHARHKRKAEAEGFYIVEKMVRLGIVTRSVEVDGAAAVLQTFCGTKVDGRPDLAMEAAHVMPCQLTFNKVLPYLIEPPDGYKLSHKFQHRNILLYSSCSWQPSIVNRIDLALEHSPGDFVTMYIDAVRAITRGHAADDVYGRYSRLKSEKLSKLCDAMNAQPTVHPTRTQLKGQTVEEWNTQRETILEVYSELEAQSPSTAGTGELKQQINRETWLIEI
jgi:hypothetical protein